MSNLKIPSSNEVQEKSLRDAIDALVAECTEKQVSFLNRIHDNAPWKGLKNCPVTKLTETYELLRRTVSENQS